MLRAVAPARRSGSQLPRTDVEPPVSWTPNNGSAYSASSGGACSRRTWLRRSEEHTSELQSRLHLVCRLLLEKKKKSLFVFIGAAPRTECLDGLDERTECAFIIAG